MEWLTRHAAWQREGYADASAKLAALGKRGIVESVPVPRHSGIGKVDSWLLNLLAY